MVRGIDIKVVVGRTGTGRRGIVTGGAAAVADPEKTDTGSLIGLVKLFKLKGGLRFRCVCQCVYLSVKSLSEIIIVEFRAAAGDTKT